MSAFEKQGVGYRIWNELKRNGKKIKSTGAWSYIENITEMDTQSNNW